MAIIKDKNIGIAAIPLSFKRDNPIPLDSTMIWYNFAAMQAYAQSSPVAYVGQLLTLVDSSENTSKLYIIKDLAGNLELINGAEGDYLPITGGTLTGPLTLNDGSLAASQTYVAEQIEAAGHLSREIVNELPPVAEAKANTIYMIKDSSVAAGDAYREYLLINGEFVQIGDTSVDLTGVVRAAEPPLTADKIVVANNQGLLVSSDININNIPVKGDDENYVSDAQLQKLDDLALIKSVGDGLNLDNNGVLTANLRGVKLVDTAATVTDGYAIIPFADSIAPGIIKGGENVSVQNDGTLNVERVDVNALYQNDGDWLVLNGSDASNQWQQP